MQTFPMRLPLAALAVALLGGCASLSDDHGFAAVETGVARHLPQKPVWTRDAESRAAADARIEALLAEPLTADGAVEIALLNNPGLQAAYHELGFADAERVRAARLPNPGLSIGRLTRGSEVEWERSLHLNLAALLALPLRADIEARRFEATRQDLVRQTLAVAYQARRAWIVAVAAGGSAVYQRQAMEAAEASAELARRMAEAGNWSSLQRAREQAFYADTALAVARAEQARMGARERLLRVLGLSDPARLRLPERLPALPDTLPPLAEVEQRALDTRLDLAGARMAAEVQARNLGLTRRTRFINVLELGVINNGSNEEPQQRGYEISVELPLFDFGSTRVAQAEALYGQTLARAREIAVDARSEIREAYAMRASQYAIARHLADEVVPLRKRISEENVLRYNGMLISVFELLADARVQIAAVNAALDAQRDYWLAEADWAMAQLGTPGTTGQPGLANQPAMASSASADAGGH
ncbi:MAG: RND transporter [Hydrogenophilales bacterium 16-64-46]|nr:MAG: RND transporter [Hydrogenophilales bacterium 12-64-13]OYZ06908.1 MAG: RND transporter [Hydrogenophilales bacterium 16-64-46]OZA39568.1 MAG: RND transporter [Hydrogenophilales bacterium 17-64-34]